MKPVSFVAAAAVVVAVAVSAGCASTSSASSTPSRGRLDAADTNAYAPHSPRSPRLPDTGAPAGASPAPRLSVGTTYPDTQLILPWFLNDVIDFVNYR